MNYSTNKIRLYINQTITKDCLKKNMFTQLV